MSTKQHAIETIFNAAKALASEQQRQAYLDLACGPDASLRREIELLLNAASEAESFFAEKPAGLTDLSQTELQTKALDRPGMVIGRYTLLQKIGEGGFGAVYMAEQREPVRRRVALKIIKLGMDTQQVVARFEAERQALALMDHPNIARVLDGGAVGCAEPQISDLRSQIPSGRPFLVMELVKGQPITQYCDERKLSTRQRLELFIPVCQAIQHAHQKGIVHRDIKPANILIAAIDGQAVPKVIDFGIAKAIQHDLTDKIVFTQFHQFLGTPAYMSPEQAAMDSTDIDTRSDIYSLGVLLYELLTGKTPLEAKELEKGGYDEIRRRIREVEPPRPSQRLTTLTNDELTTVARSRAVEPAKLSKLIRGELDWIVLKAMEKDRSRRYETASALALDIRRYLDNEPVSAVKPSRIYQFQKFARRHKAALAAAACFALLLTVSACVSAAQALKNKSLFTEAEEARLNELSAKERETELRRIAEGERDRSQRLLYVAQMNLAKAAWDHAKVGRMHELLEEHRPKPGQSDLRGFEWFYLDRLRHSDLLTLRGHSNAVTSVAISPDGKRLASGSADRTVKVWDAASGREIFTFNGHTQRVYGVAFSPDGKFLASASGDKTLKVWDAMTAQELLTLKGHAKGVNSVEFSPNGQRLASASSDQTVKVWDALTGQELLTLVGHDSGVLSVAFSRDGKRLATFGGGLGRPAEVKLWDALSGEVLFTLKGPSQGLGSVALSPDGRHLASGSSDQTVRVWDIATTQVALTLKGHRSAVEGVAFSPDGKWLASASYDQTVKVWDTSNGQETLTLKGHSGGVTSLDFGPDGTWLASASYDQTVKLWDLTREQETLTLKGHTNYALHVAFSPDGQRLASTGWDETVRVWEIAGGEEQLTLRGHTGQVQSVVFSPDEKWLASAGIDHTLRIWNTANGQQTHTLRGHTDWVASVAFSPDGKRLTSASGDRTVKVWDAESGRVILTLEGHTGYAIGVAFSPDGRKLASTGEDQTVRLWDAATGQETLTLKGHTDSVTGVAFSADGKWLASACQDRTIKIWDARTGQEALTLKGHAAAVWKVAFSPDGNRLASASWDQTVKVWDVASGQETLTLTEHTAPVVSVAFSPNGSWLASAGLDGTVKLWDARTRTESSTR